MLDGEIFALSGFKIVFGVRVQREDHTPAFFARLADAFRHGGNDRARFGRAQRAVDEIVLHVHDDQDIFHVFSSFLVPVR